MATLAISVDDMPPIGELETTGAGTSPTQAQMDEETQARQNFIDIVSPHLKSLPAGSPHRASNVSSIELLGLNVWSQLNHYLLHVTSIAPPSPKQTSSGRDPGQCLSAALALKSPAHGSCLLSNTSASAAGLTQRFWLNRRQIARRCYCIRSSEGVREESDCPSRSCLATLLGTRRTRWPEERERRHGQQQSEF